MRKTDHSHISGRLLSLFLAVYETNSVGRAADVLEINQSSVSHGLDTLRSIFDDPLFIRSGRGITPTERAIALAPEVRAMLASMENMIRPSAYDPLLDERALTLAGNIDALSELFVLIRDRIFASAPQMKVTLIEAGARTSVERILDLRQAEVVIAARVPSYSGALDSANVLTSRMVCYTDPVARKPVRSKKAYTAARHAVVGFGGPGKSIVDEAMEEHNIRRNVVLRAPSFFTLAKMMEGTDLVATMPEYLGRTVFTAMAKNKPPLSLPNVEIDMVWHRRSAQSGRNNWIRKNVLESAKILQEQHRNAGSRNAGKRA